MLKRNSEGKTAIHLVSGSMNAPVMFVTSVQQGCYKITIFICTWSELPSSNNRRGRSRVDGVMPRAGVQACRFAPVKLWFNFFCVPAP